MSTLREVQDTGLDWLGSIPAHWQLKRLGSVFRERKQTVSDTDYPPLSVTMQGIVPQIDNVAKTMNNDARKLVLAGDYVINSRSDRKGSGGLADRDGSVSVISTVLEPQGVHPRFAHHLLRSSAFQEEFYRWGSGIVADLWSTRYLAMSRIEVPLPPQEVQAEIADFLDRETEKIDAVIEKQRALVDGLRERRSAVIFNRATGTEARARSELTDWFGQPPRHWEVDKLGRRARVGNGSTPSSSTPAYWEGGTIPWLNSSVVNTGFVMEPSRLVTEVATRECHLPIVRAGAILMAITGQGKTRGMVAELGIDSTINQHLAFINPDPDYWHVPYLVLLLRAAYGELRRISEESGSTKGALTCSGISAFKVPRPPLEEQRAIAVRLDQETAKIDALIVISERLIELSHERRAALITAAVTGQLDITTDPNALEGAA